jgi:hypothetical protein
MHGLKIIFGVALLLLIISTGWQISSCELANIEMQDDIRDLASQLGTRIGLTQPPSDQDLRDEIVRRGRRYGLELESSQITVQRVGSGENMVVRLSAAYTASVHLPGFSFDLHFNPSSDK